MISLMVLLMTIALMLGPMGHLATFQPLTPNLLIVFLWADGWFRDRQEAFRLAVVGGLLLDLASFSFFGLWTISAFLVVLTITALKTRWLDAARLIHSLLALSVVSLIPLLLLSIVTKSFVFGEIVLAVLGNVTLGLIVYYLLAMRFKLFQRWAGRRIG